ncbi:hypothetical protein DESC_780051 [Desulfosarcina cetonica]|uniref:hypothetical protein n=1 Tax=Desulfosarcina cetonica TaxID=90730 RepID=UPI0006CFBFC7|nr:hypothetical protein [Desulfosarcina cetonica]VTR69863.1 hypothetical protein DESC_780051 [Desulfosarcina cetonica]
MSETYLTPLDVDAASAARVLGFLNAAASAEEIAAAVEIPDERDVGVRLGQRIIDRRSELGSFTDLRQIRDIPYIGPERFTEIVTGITGLVNSPPSGTAPLYDELARLRRQVATLGSHIDALMTEVSISADRGTPLLGQPVRITARVTGGIDNRPRPGIPVTFIAPSATIEHAEGMIRRTGISATLLTGPGGVARVTVRVATDEPMLPAQKTALISQLADFPDVETPSRATAFLDQLIADYAWDVNHDFRAAVDLLYKTYARSLIDGVNAFDYLAQWPRVDVPITATADGGPNETEGMQVRGGAVFTIPFRNWLGPWLQRFHNRAHRNAAFDQNIRAVAGSANAAEAIMQQTADFVHSRRGLVGAFMGLTEAQRTLNAFIAEDMPGVAPEARTGLISVLQGANAMLNSGGADAVAGIVGVRKQLTEEVRNAPVSDQLNARLISIESALDAKANQADVSTALAGKVDNQTFSDYQQTVDFRFEGFATLDAYQAFQNRITDQLETKADVSAVAAVQANVDAKLDQSVFANFRETVEQQMAVKVDQTEFTQYKATIKTRFDKTPTLETLNTRNAELARRIELLETGRK